MDEDESDEDDGEEEYEGDVVRYLNKKDGWGMEGEESEEEEESNTTTTTVTRPVDGHLVLCLFSRPSISYFSLLSVAFENESGMAVLEDAVSFLVSFLEFLGVFVSEFAYFFN